MTMALTLLEDVRFNAPSAFDCYAEIAELLGEDTVRLRQAGVSERAGEAVNHQ